MDIQHGFVGWKDAGRAADASSVVDFAEVFAWKRQKRAKRKQPLALVFASWMFVTRFQAASVATIKAA